MLLLPLQAVVAGIAGTTRGIATRSPTTRPETPFAQSFDGSGNLMAKYHRLAHPHRAEAAVIIVVQVAAADAAGFDCHLHLSGAEVLDHAVLGSQVFSASLDREGWDFSAVLYADSRSRVRPR